MKILAFGEIIWDVFPDKRCIGGAPLNFAAHSAALGADSYILSAVGEDALAAPAKKALSDFAVSDKYVGLSTLPTGRCDVSLDINGIPSYSLLDNTAYDDIKIPNGIENEHFDAICMGTLSIRHSTSRKTLEKLLEYKIADEFFADVNIRAPHFTKENITLLLENSSILKISDEELSVVMSAVFSEEGKSVEECAKFISERYENIKIIIITLGAKGAYALDCKEKKEYRQKPYETEVLSTVGAGDSFGAAFLVKYLSGNPISECLDFASRLSAFVVSRTEAIPKYDPQNL